MYDFLHKLRNDYLIIQFHNIRNSATNYKLTRFFSYDGNQTDFVFSYGPLLILPLHLDDVCIVSWKWNMVGTNFMRLPERFLEISLFSCYTVVVSYTLLCLWFFHQNVRGFLPSHKQIYLVAYDKFVYSDTICNPGHLHMGRTNKRK